MVRNRIDAVRLLLGKDSGYTLRTFKKIMKRDRDEKPDLVNEMISKLKSSPESDNLDDDFEDVEAATELDMTDY